MRRNLATIAVLAVFAAACGQTVPTMFEPLRAGHGPDPQTSLEIATARETLVGFLDAYARSGEDGGNSLVNYVGGVMRRWAYWLTVQNANAPGPYPGQATIESVSFVGFRSATGGQIGAVLDVRASVELRPKSGNPVTHLFDGPAELVTRDGIDWSLIDIYRDGSPMSKQIGYFTGTQTTFNSKDLMVRLDSIFRFSHVWEFNLSVTNKSGATVGATKVGTLIAAKGLSPESPVWITPSITSVPKGRRRDGIIDFEAPKTNPGQIALEIRFRRSGESAESVAFPISLAPPASGSPSPAPASVGPSGASPT